MERERPIWAPWRIEYILGDKEDGCLFCRVAAEPDDEKNLVLHRGKTAFVIMNLYPYNPGHLMVAPRRHTGALDALSAAEHAAVAETVRRAVAAVAGVFGPDGFNVGMNVGAAAGAGFADHLHWHVVPRWTGDTNFMPVLADTRVMPQHLEETWERLRPAFAWLEPA